jgi:hypothetical protein
MQYLSSRRDLHLNLFIFTYFLKKDNLTMWDLSANAHWLFPIADKVTVYPLAGLGILNYGSSYGGYSASSADIAFNLGGGVDKDRRQSAGKGQNSPIADNGTDEGSGDKVEGSVYSGVISYSVRDGVK